jgi:hypothetical protein
MARNQLHDAGFVLGSNIGKTLYYHNAAALVSIATGESAEELRNRWQAEAEARFAAAPEQYAAPAARNDYLVSRAKALIAERPLLYARLHLRPTILLPDAPSFFELLGLTQTGRGTLDVLNREGLLAAVRHYFDGRLWLPAALAPLLAVTGLLYLGCAAAVLHWLRRREVFLLFAFLAFVVYYLVLPGPIVMPRYHLPALPMMAVMAGLTVTWAWQCWRSRKSAGATA